VNSLASASEDLALRRCKPLNSPQIDDFAQLGQPAGNERRQRVEPLLLSEVVRRQFAQPTRFDIDVLDRLADETVRDTSGQVDPEPLYYQAAILAFCGRKEISLSLLRVVIGRDYCAYGALQSDPLLSKLRDHPEFPALLTAAKQCQQKYLAAHD